jgi:hypothetical protein
MLAVFGLYAAVRLFCIWLFTPREVVAAIKISEPLTAEEAALLFCRARQLAFVSGREEWIVCVPETLEGANEIVEQFRRLGVKSYILRE